MVLNHSLLSTSFLTPSLPDDRPPTVQLCLLSPGTKNGSTELRGGFEINAREDSSRESSADHHGEPRAPQTDTASAN
jgi:hypothetical protein